MSERYERERECLRVVVKEWETEKVGKVFVVR